IIGAAVVGTRSADDTGNTDNADKT
ncbi:MAG: hypothetical protein RL513_1755, partial [Pseudomonadota bacterium]